MRELPIDSIRPTQLWISRRKYDHWSSRLFSHESDSYDPVPVKRIGRDLFFTDGHTRALRLFQLGCSTIRTFDDTDEMDWIAYVEDLAWCRDAGIMTVGDLDGRIVPDDEYEEKWIARCDRAREARKRDPLGGLEIGFEDDPDTKGEIAREILESLPGWFGIASAVKHYVDAVASLPFVRIDLYGKPIGFCALSVSFGRNADLYVLGIFEEFHRRGIGKRMIEFIESYCVAEGIRFMSVKTLSSRHPDEGYRHTREFYERVGFLPFEELPTLWGETNPCLYLIKPVKPPRRS